MDRRIVEINKNIMIKQGMVNGTSTYNFTINTVDFIPDEVIVKYIVYNLGGNDERLMFYIYSDLVSDIMGVFINNVVESTYYNVNEDGEPDTVSQISYEGVSAVVFYPNTHFILRRPIKGQYSFNILNTNNIPIDILEGELCIALEFVQYRKDLPDKKIF